MKLGDDFYQRPDVVCIARELLGKVLFTRKEREITAGIIVETEAYEGVTDRASHAWNGRRTKRTESMYTRGGTSYVYLCYGIHHLFNIVTNKEEIPHAILVRAVEPVEGINLMLKRRKKSIMDYSLSSGPGSLTRALGISVKDDMGSLTGGRIWIEDRGIIVKKNNLISTLRIGVDYAGEHARWPYRFLIKDNLWVSRKVQI